MILSGFSGSWSGSPGSIRFEPEWTWLWWTSLTNHHTHRWTALCIIINVLIPLSQLVLAADSLILCYFLSSSWTALEYVSSSLSWSFLTIPYNVTMSNISIFWSLPLICLWGCLSREFSFSLIWRSTAINSWCFIWPADTCFYIHHWIFPASGTARHPQHSWTRWPRETEKLHSLDRDGEYRIRRMVVEDRVWKSDEAEYLWE